MRTLSSAIQAVLDRNYGETRDIVEITIPASTPYPQTTLYFANGSGVSIGGIDYVDKLRSIGSLKFRLGSAPDNAEVNLENVSMDMGFILTDTARVIDGSQVVIKKAFKIDTGEWEAVTLFVGQVSNIKVDQDNISLTVISDMSKRGTSVAGRTVTQRCIWTFNKNGSGIGPQCGWTPAQPGNTTSCDHDIDSANGCKAHGNLHRIGAVPAFTSLAGNNGYDSNGSGWGMGSGGGWCVHPDTLILCEIDGHKFFLKAYQVREGETIVTLNEFGKILTTKIVKADKAVTDTLYVITSKKGYGVHCSPTHPFIRRVGDNEGTPAHLLKEGDEVLCYDNITEEFHVDEIETITKITTNCHVIMFGLEEPYHLYVGGSSYMGGFWFHNLKPAYTDPDFDAYRMYQGYNSI